MGEKFDKTVKIASGVGAVLTAAVTIIRVFSGK
jgi:hypothetical protein